jgi:hypothetical protein
LAWTPVGDFSPLLRKNPQLENLLPTPNPENALLEPRKALLVSETYGTCFAVSLSSGGLGSKVGLFHAGRSRMQC